MGVKSETYLQRSIQKLIEKRGGYVNKNLGSMVSEPGIADLTACYKGFYLAIEVKVDDNEPSRHQGIHCRKVLAAGGISVVVWSLKEVEIILDIIDYNINNISVLNIKDSIKSLNIDDGSRW